MTATYSFLRWLRTGLAGSISGRDGAGLTASRASFDAALQVGGIGTLPARSVALHGPGDVVGVNPRQVVRRFPDPGTTTADASAFAHIELDDPDLPWRYTPYHEATAGDPAGSALLREGTLSPWLCLVVVEERNGVSVDYTPGGLLPVLSIEAPAVVDDELPRLDQIAAWAHVQVVGDLPGDLTGLLDNDPHRTLARLVCPRLLAPRTSYVACLVPVFAAGRQAGLGEPVTAQLDDRAWAPGDASARLPVYDSYRFATGPGGDFEALVRRLRHVHLDQLSDSAGSPAVGRRTLDVTSPGFGVLDRPATLTATMFGALRLEGDDPLEPGDAGLGADIAAAADVADALAPPVYGRWHAAADVPGRAAWPVWLAHLNEEPGLRAIAGEGARIVRERQEEFMAACWEQVGAITEANQALRQAQLALHASSRLHERHIASLPPPHALGVLSPALSRLHSPADATRSQWADIDGSCLPMLALSGGFRRLTRPRGPLVRRIEAWQRRDVIRRYDPGLLVTALAGGDRLAAAPDASPALRAGLGAVAAGLGGRTRWQGTPPDPADVKSLRSVLGMLATRAGSPTACAPLDVAAAAARAVEGVDPRTTVPRRARAQLDIPAGLWDPADRIDPVMVAPEITTPMYPAIVARGQDWLLPGLQHVPDDSVSALTANQVFVEALLAGMNHEMARELLWRGYPTDQRGTVFKHFWDRRVATAASPGDITGMDAWEATDELGTHQPAATPSDAFVFLLRGELLRRFPRASIFLVPATLSGGTAQPVAIDATSSHLPIFSGWLDPDVTFLGFDVPTPDVQGATPPTVADPGYFVVIAEQPTQPSFGVSAASGALGGDGHYASWSDLGAGDLETVGARRLAGQPIGYVDLAATSSAAFLAAAPAGPPAWDGRSDTVAAIFLRRPFRFYLHGSDILQAAP